MNYLNNAKEAKILDVGSYNVNGCYREIFQDAKFEYTGLDMEPGPNVDLVPKSPYSWSELANDSFDVVISGQALEHIEFFWITMSEIVRVTKEGGLICLIAPNGFGEHRYPVDCWRFFSDGMVALARFTSLEVLHAHTNAAPTKEDQDWFSSNCADTMLIARKPYSGTTRIVDASNYTCVPANLKALRQSFITMEESNIVQAQHEEEMADTATIMLQEQEQTSKPQKSGLRALIHKIARKARNR